MSFKPIKVIDVELSEPLRAVEGLSGYAKLQVLVRLRGAPLGMLQLPLVNGCCSAAALGTAILEQHSWSIIRHLASGGLSAGLPLAQFTIDDLVGLPHPVYAGPLPLVTVAVCTRDRAADLALCLEALARLEYPAYEVLVVDNAPSDDATERLVRERFPLVRYVCEPRPGLDWARNRAILEARGEIVAYTDDDVIVDPGWVAAIARIFAENPNVMAVTGLVLPYELETEAQALFESYGGFGRGFERKWYHLDPKSRRQERLYAGSGIFGTGANMAYRRSVFERIGTFDPALDVGTVTNGGGDIEMFFRVLKEGHTLVYEPGAIVRHRHRRDYARLRTQIANNGVGFFSYLVRTAMAYPDSRATLLRLGLWWLWWWNIRRLLKSFIHSAHFPRDLIWAELRGSFAGLRRYQQARRTAAEIARSFGPVVPSEAAIEPAPIGDVATMVVLASAVSPAPQELAS